MDVFFSFFFVISYRVKSCFDSFAHCSWGQRNPILILCLYTSLAALKSPGCWMSVYLFVGDRAARRQKLLQPTQVFTNFVPTDYTEYFFLSLSRSFVCERGKIESLTKKKKRSPTISSTLQDVQITGFCTSLFLLGRLFFFFPPPQVFNRQ